MAKDQRARELVNELEVRTTGQSSPLAFVVPAVHDLVGMDGTVGLSFTEVGGDVALQDVRMTNIPDEHGLIRMYRGLIDAPRRASHFAARSLQPDAWRANELVVSRRIRALASIGLADHEHMCVQIYDGRSLVAWIGGFQRKPFARRQRMLFDSIVPALCRRFTLERRMADLSRTIAVLKATLDAIAAPAFLIGRRGEILNASATARALLDGDRRRIRQSLVDAVVGAKGGERWELTAFHSEGAPVGFLAVQRAPVHRTRVEEAVHQATQRWRLTARQRDVLEHVASGLTNARVAEELGIGAGTVEFHLKALFDKAGVDNRTTLIGRLFDV